jgi:hypothetical protein
VAYAGNGRRKLTVEDPGHLSEKGTDPLGTVGNLDVQELLHS